MSKSKTHVIEVELMNFISNIDGLYDSFLLSSRSISRARKEFNAKLVEFEEKYCFVFQREEDGVQMIAAKPEYSHRWRQMRRIKTRLDASYKTVPASFVVALVSQYDAFLGRLIQSLFEIKQDIINLSEKTFTFSELMAFGSIDAAKNHLIEKEVETVLRDSHVEQFKWLETKFGLQLRKGLKSWPQFVEITERRNLLVHTGGHVSSQYIKNCKEQNVELSDDVKPGLELRIDAKYVAKTYSCMLEIAFKLAHVLWRKLDAKSRSQADSNLNHVAYEFIVEGKYGLAANLLELGTSEMFKKDSSDLHQRLFIINKAQAYKWMGDEPRMLEILSEEDWSASRNDFQLANTVLKEEFAKAAAIMKKIGCGPDAEVKNHDYSDWPLFQKFIASTEFLDAYFEIYNQPFVEVTQDNSD